MKKITLVLILMLIVSLTVPSNHAFGEKEAKKNIAKGVSLIVNGIGSYSCGNKQINNIDLFLLVSEQGLKGGFTGSSGLGLTDREHKMIGAALENGFVSEKKFELTGLVLVDDICGQDESSIMKINGNCGSKSVIQIKSGSGNSGTFSGKSLCKILKNR